MSTIRSVDHLVLPVASLASARERWTSLGFTVAPDARHPFGTGNCCVFFENRTYLEPLAVVDRAAAEQAESEDVLFVSRAAGYVARRGEGFAMLALRSEDAAADHAAFVGAGVSRGSNFRFSRKAVLPDGKEREIGVILAFAVDEQAPDATFFACQHLAAGVLWRPEYVAHPNGARGIVAVSAVASSPADFHILAEAVTGQRELRVTSFEIEAEMAGATFTIFSPLGFRAHFGVEAPDPGQGLLLAGMEIEVADIDAAASFAPGSIGHNRMIVVPPHPGQGAVVAFRGRSE